MRLTVPVVALIMNSTTHEYSPSSRNYRAMEKDQGYVSKQLDLLDQKSEKLDVHLTSNIRPRQQTTYKKHVQHALMDWEPIYERLTSRSSSTRSSAKEELRNFCERGCQERILNVSLNWVDFLFS
ncbi:hypothetical protein L596_025434 [Steinernema carpocapsae]|uniref:Uncharacterized protein n=1 Tax=Steinernema carpocapsae TaxID=34508 RepID=A0A4U5M7S9_STECR|nr:hypothetical protein L596_025434 [Steinernema carpocapsae]